MYSGAAASGGGGGGGGGGSSYSPGPGAPQTGWTQGNDYFGAEYGGWPGYLLDFNNTPVGCSTNSNFNGLGSVLNHSSDVLVVAYNAFAYYNLTTDGTGVLNRDLATVTNQTTLNTWYDTGTQTMFPNSPGAGRDCTLAYLSDAARTPVYIMTYPSQGPYMLDMNGNYLNNGNTVTLGVDGSTRYPLHICWDGEHVVCSDGGDRSYHLWELPSTHTGSWTLKAVINNNSGITTGFYGMVYAGKDGAGYKYVIQQSSNGNGHIRHALPPVTTWNGDESWQGTNLIANISHSYAQGANHTAFPSNAYQPLNSWGGVVQNVNYSTFIDYYNQIFVSGGLSNGNQTVFKHI